MASDLETRFEAAMRDLLCQARKELRHGDDEDCRLVSAGLPTARILLNAESVTEDFAALAKLERLDLTVEALIFHEPDFEPLFNDSELAVVRRRLKDFQYAPATDPLEEFIGAFASNDPGWSTRIDELLGEQLAKEARGQNGAGR